MNYIILNNGVKMPKLGFGTINQFGNQIIENVNFALNNGYQLIDTANRYGNEVEVGKGIKKSGIKREDIFLETKLGPTLYENNQAIDDTLKRLDVDYIDLMLLHHPVNNYIYAYKMLEKAYKEGKIKSIGISNFEGKYIEEVLNEFEITPQVIQVEAHPYFTQDELRKITDKEDIKIMSWYPLGHEDSSLINETVFTELANKYGKSNAQIILKWHTQMGFIVIPGTKTPEHIKENHDIYDFTLTDEEMEQIAKINKNVRYYNRTDAQLEQFASWEPDFENQK